jgi:hypothetical protein
MELLSPIETSVAGVTFRVEYPQNLYKIGALVALNNRRLRATLVRELDNDHDQNAIRVVVDKEHVGYIPAKLAKRMSEEIDNGATWIGVVDRMIISPENPEQPGLRIRVFRRDTERKNR